MRNERKSQEKLRKPPRIQKKTKEKNNKPLENTTKFIEIKRENTEKT